MVVASIALLLHLFLAKFCPPKNKIQHKHLPSKIPIIACGFFFRGVTTVTTILQSAVPSPRFFDTRPKLQSSATQHESPLPHLPTKNIVWEADFFSRWKPVKKPVKKKSAWNVNVEKPEIMLDSNCQFLPWNWKALNRPRESTHEFKCWTGNVNLEKKQHHLLSLICRVALSKWICHFVFFSILHPKSGNA